MRGIDCFIRVACFVIILGAAAGQGLAGDSQGTGMLPLGMEVSVPLESTSSVDEFTSWQAAQTELGTAVGETEESDLIFRGASRKSSLSRQILNKSGLSSMTQVWANAYLGGGTLEPQNTPEMDRDLLGAMVGMNFSMLGGTVSGFYNYNKGSLEAQNSSLDQTTNLGGIGYSNSASCIYWSLVGAGGIDSYETSGAMPARSFDGWQALGLIEVGGEMDTGSLFVLRPFTMLQYSYLKHDGLPDVFEEQKNAAFWSTMGSRVDIRLGSDTFKIQGRMAWVHQLLSDNDPITNYWFGRVAGTVTPSQCHFTGSTGRDYFWGGIGLKMAFFSRIAISLDYDVLMNGYQNVQLGSLGLLMAF
ncbi:MAG: autotransporter outer membrane beta-barrel domain-containing protein [Planctomycetia bacterium]|nr:autotransporter outer membrane beta-barrel domain-containing protein [Planctomycetia bacterium]